jgi:TATA-box binding protein (TBP) (component of TFIID and TFIIIB)
MNLTNIKYSFKIKPITLSTVAELVKEWGYKYKEFPNFIVIRIPNRHYIGGDCFRTDSEWVCTVFKKNAKDIVPTPNHVNATNLRSRKELRRLIEILSAIGLTYMPDTAVVDNVTGLMTVGKIVLEEVIKAVPSNKQEACQILDRKFGAIHSLTIQYNNERFPGLFIKFTRNLKKAGTAIVFHSGKIVFVGCKGMDELKCLAQAVNALISIK